MIRALMLDVDGVLVTGRSAGGEHWATSLGEDLGVEYAFLQQRFFRPYWRDIVVGRAAMRERLATALEGHPSGVSAECLVDYWFHADSHIDVAVLEAVGAARAGGLRVHLCTNQEHERAAFLMEGLGLAAHVDGCCYSASMGIAKPSPDFFRAVEARTALPPEALLLVDDSADNVAAARVAGWSAELWRRGESLARILAGYGLTAGDSSVMPAARRIR